MHGTENLKFNVLLFFHEHLYLLVATAQYRTSLTVTNKAVRKSNLMLNSLSLLSHLAALITGFSETALSITKTSELMKLY
jgi:hypothetical protein